MPRKTPRRDPLMVEVLAALGDVTLKERYLIDQSKPVTNWQDGEYLAGTVTINPVPFIVTTLIHEILHHIRPTWSETVILRRCTQLLRGMTHDEAKVMYNEWLKRKE
jgi:hypothetical protein